MNKSKVTYWISTSLLVLLMLVSAITYFTSDQAKQGFHHLGFPDYFRIELAIAKIVGAIGLILPIFSRAKEWLYAGFGITFISAVIAHTFSGDPAAMIIPPIVAFAVLIVSYTTHIQLSRKERTTV